MFRRTRLWITAFFVLFSLRIAYADSSFDLAGPRMEVQVTRGGKSLPISEVPTLQAGDRLWIHPAFPAQQAVHYVLVVAFLQGATNPPPDKWFTKAETWSKQLQAQGMTATVPEHAQQALFFLAPVTGGDFSTIRSAVRGKPGAFVRAVQDLNLAAQSRLRVETYLQAIRNSPSPTELQARSKLLARSLKLKVNEDCFDKPVERQVSCLVDSSDQMVMDDGHGQSMLVSMTSGPEGSLLGAVGGQVGGGSYSPYIGAIVDMVGVFENLHTAQYQYIPALALPQGVELNLKLNNPPSFHKPKSVLVVALPAIQPVIRPPLTPVDSKQVYCVQKPSLALQADGAPLAFATDVVHALTLHLQDKNGKSMDLPVRADAAQGGFVLQGTVPDLDKLGPQLTGTLRGSVGFDRYEGPVFHLRNAAAAARWKLSEGDQGALIVGREDTFHLHSELAACVREITVKDQSGKTIKTSWKTAAPDNLEVKVALADTEPGEATLAVKEFGVDAPVDIALRAYAEEVHLDQFTLHAGEETGMLKGARLDEVASLSVNGTQFLPATLTRTDKVDELRLVAGSAASSFQPDEKITAEVKLKDGRKLKFHSKVEARRPRLILVNKSIQSARSAIRLGSEDDLPLDGRITFFVKSEVPVRFPHDEKIEIAGVDDSFHTMLSLADKNLSLQDPQTAVATLDPLKSFGDSAFGPLQFRAVAADGTAGEWQKLAYLVRTPRLREVRCPDDPEKPCTLNGDLLYLIDSIASDKNFTQAVSVPSGFADSSLTVPRPNGTVLYMKLRDDPATINTAVLPVLPEQSASPAP